MKLIKTWNIKQNDFLAEQIIKHEISQLFSKKSMEMILVNTENSKANEPHNFLTCQRD